MVYKNLNFQSKFSVELMNTVFNCLNEAGVRWWVDQGTLLGFVRDEQPIPWDEDVDISAHMNDVEKVHHAMKLLSNHGIQSIFFPYRDIFKIYCYDLKGNKDWNIEISLYYQEGNLYKKKFMSDYDGLQIIGSLLKLFYKALLQIPLNPGHSIKASFIYKTFLTFSFLFPTQILHWISIKIYYLSYGKNEVIIQAPIIYFQSIISKDYKSFMGVKIPSNAEKYLEFKYGNNWKTPIQDWVFWQQDGAIIKK